MHPTNAALQLLLAGRRRRHVTPGTPSPRRRVPAAAPSSSRPSSREQTRWCWGPAQCCTCGRAWSAPGSCRSDQPRCRTIRPMSLPSTPTHPATNISHQISKKGKGSPYSITERRVPELIPVLGSQPASDVSHEPDSRLSLLSARPAVTFTTLKRAATNFAAWWTEARWVWTICLRLLPNSVATWTQALVCLNPAL